ncbi:MAG: biotin--[acetyl-CoA-carboxylase] ligase [Rhodospirillaceae bacterium]|jgi:BirA family transcriptional regulator, biotin operon repressor / biotin---[acetyl-CoA-carboxylase] ligase|nr:biotin--[acetyl-CoA-carboxylase] ligase [Rhodospirillaceae bacterium]MBT4589296.1 biotin--[acetyl-CoA-carboxylase] ligase [Rhodospirillaceae bacterium]MBT7267181.1 biotin--[acetyl-CoA-carboxylase] ligase [Rhodospirillaceae bacterium]
MSDSPQLPAGFNLVKLDSIGSTNEELKQRTLKENAAEGLVVWALEQTAGKGRQKRDWVSKPGNMYCSVLFRPDCAMAEAAQIGFLPVIAAGEALVSLLGNAAPLRYKWPNDLLLNRKKIGGALLEAGVGQNGLAAWVVIGCGLNLQHYPDGTRFPATSVHDEMDTDLAIEAVIEAYLQCLASWYHRWQEDGFEPVRQAWLASAHTFDEPLVIETGSDVVSGPFRDLDENGALVIETDDGPRRISVGDVYFKESDEGA